MSLLNLLTVIFVLAKLGGFVQWSWWIVLAPAILGFGLSLLIILLGIIGYLAND